MAGFVDLLKLIVDADTKGAVSAFNKLENEAGSSLQGVERQASTSLSGIEGKASGFGSKLSGGFTALSSSMLSSLGPAAIAGGVGAGIGIAVNAASNLNEQISKTQAVFGSSANDILAWSDTAATSLGQSKTQALEAASSFGNMFLQLGLGSGVATEMSKAMTGLATDFASFFNTDPATALEAISAAFRGEFDSVQKFVPTINAAAVEQEALKEGLAATTKELTQQDKATATYNLLLNGAGKATGDFARTSDSLANQQRILKAQLSDTAAEIGNSLIPALVKIAQTANAAIGWIEKVGTAVQNLDRVSGQGEGGLLGQLTGNKGFDSKSWSEFFGFADKTPPKVQEVTRSLKDLAGSGASDLSRIANGADTAQASMLGLNTATGAFGTAAQDFRRLTNAVDAIVTSSDMIPMSADAAANAISREGSEMGDLAAKTQAANDALQENVNAQLAAFDATFAVTQAQADFAKAHQESTTAMNEGKVSMGELQLTLDAETQSAEKAALAIQAKYEKDQLAATGAVDAAASNRVFIGALEALAAQASGPSKAALNTLIATLKDTGAQQPKPTVTLVDQASGPLRGVKDGLDGVRGTYTATVDVNTSSANARLNALRDRLNAAARSGVQILGGTGGVAFAEGGMVPGAKGQPLAATVHGGEYVLPADLVDAIKQGRPPSPFAGGMAGVSGASGGNAIVINFNGLVTDEFAVGREIKRVLAKSSYSGVS